MASEPPHHAFSQRLPPYQVPDNRQYPLGYHAYGAQRVHHSPAVVDPYTRIAVLEKELENCQTGKAEAEIAIQYLAILNGKGATKGGNGDEQITKLKQQLEQAAKEKDAFEAKLENALAIITTILTSKTLNPVLHSASTTNTFEAGPGSGMTAHIEDLIDLAGASKGFDSSSTSGNDATLLDQSSNDFSQDEDGAQSTGQAKQSLTSELTDCENEPYIHHFLPSVHDAPIKIAKTASEVPTPDARGVIHPKNSNSSPDQRSETSIEPETDVSSHEYATSSDGPVSSFTSFVTANTQLNNAHGSPAKNLAKKAVEARAVGVQEWNIAASAASFEDVKASGLAIHFKEKMWSSKNEEKYSVAKSSQSPFLQEPSWQVCKLFSTRRQREDTIAFHKAEIGPDERNFVPDLLKYGVRFEPRPSERNIYRTVLVRGLSLDTTMHQLLQNVRGGKVVDAKLLETCKFIGSNSALIIFLHEHAAIAYEEYTRINSLTVNNQLVSVKVVNSPTYPTRIGLKKAIEDLQHTRCLEIREFPRHVSEFQLRLDLRVSSQMNGDRVEHLKMRKDGILELHFPSIDYAGQGFGMFTTYRLYKGCKACFVPDPCAQPLKTLLQKSTCETVGKAACLELESSAIEEFERLAKIEWDSEAELHHGRGFE